MVEYIVVEIQENKLLFSVGYSFTFSLCRTPGLYDKFCSTVERPLLHIVLSVEQLLQIRLAQEFYHAHNHANVQWYQYKQC